MRDVIVVSQLPPPTHGSTMMTQQLLDSLTNLGYDHELVDRRFSSSIGEVGRPSLRKLVSAFGLWRRVLASCRRNPESTVVLFATTRTASFVVDWAMTEIMRALRMRTVGYLHTVGFKSLALRAGPLRWMTRRLLTSFDQVVCLSSLLEDDVAPWVAADATVSIPNTVQAARERERSPEASDPVLFLSNLIPEKGASEFISIAASAVRTRPSTRFIIAGKAADATFLRELRSLVERKGLTDYVSFRVDPSADEKWQLLASSSVLVFPTIYAQEAQPLTILEALSIGTPVVAYAAGAIRDQVTSGSSGFVVAQGDVEAAASALTGLLQDPKRLTRFSAQCRLEYEGRFSLGSYERAWQSLLGEPAC